MPSISNLPVRHTDARGREGMFVDQTAPFHRTERGSVTWAAGLQVDTDGAGRASDRSHQSKTSLLLDGKSVDAFKTPYVAIPPAVAKAAGLKLGDLVKVTGPGGTSTFALYADSNDNRARRKLGEGSPALHAALGHPLKHLNEGLDSGVSFEAFPGSGQKLGVLANGFPDAAQLNALGAKLEAPSAWSGASGTSAKDAFDHHR
jgi:hypothetical protein